MIITRTPFRISFFGGGTDYPQWSREHGGTVLATAIDKYCYLNCRYLPPFFEHHSRIIYSQIENVTNNRDIAHPAVRACLQRLAIEAGIEIHHDADLPARTGLGTSSSFVVGLLNALYALREQRRDPESLAREAIEVEQNDLRENVGAQDQVLAAYGGLQLVRFLSDGRFRVEPVVMSPRRLDELESSLHLYFTGFSRTASEIAKHQLENMAAHRRQLEEMATMALAGRDILSDENRNLQEFGGLLAEAWRLKRSLSQRITTTAIDEIYERGRQAGALGGKLLGAGGGGFILFYVPPAEKAHFLEAMAPLLRVPISISAPGSSVVLYERETLYPPALIEGRRLAYGQHS